MTRTMTLTCAALLGAFAAIPALAAGNSSLTNLTVSEAFPAWQSTGKYERKTTGGNQFFGNYAKINSTIRYDKPTNSYIIKDTGSTATSTFAPANKVAGESNATFTVYRKTSGATTETLRLFNPGASNPVVQLSYVSYGGWNKSTTGAGWNGATAVSDTWFVYGIKTPSAEVPRTGGATYTTVLDGTFVTSSKTYALSGPGSITANFGNGTIAYSATPTGLAADASVINFNPVGGSGTISFGSSSFTGNPNNANPNYKMSLSGYFYGPAAAEIGATFRLWGGGGSGNGAMVGKK